MSTGHKKPVAQAWHSKPQFESVYLTVDHMAVVLTADPSRKS